MAFSAALTVLASLSMTIGICFFFGLEFTGGKERGKQVRMPKSIPGNHFSKSQL